eukprot:TRINITY_DN4710_c0_g1_i1.p1 TRINITY_DN4710_c0_g1~~TRINITY_DN4710_c0_g1_i1.p1  ORF type:complete len:150 (+),score=2.63 TRINITY_DN4710_c0_g1_i1:222-671(+)
MTRVLLLVPREVHGSVEGSDIFWLLSQFGTVETLLDIERDRKGRYCILAQFAESSAAERAMRHLHDQGVAYPTGSYSLTVTRSEHSSLTASSRPLFDCTEINKLLSQHLADSLGTGTNTLSYLRRHGLHDYLWGRHVDGPGILYPQRVR